MRDTIVFLCQVLDDGIGDFFHYRDYHHFLRNSPRYQDYNFVSIIRCSPSYEKRIKNELKANNVENYFVFAGYYSENNYSRHEDYVYENAYRNDRCFKEVINNTILFIRISWGFEGADALVNLSPNRAATIAIDEHEMTHAWNGCYEPQLFSHYCMGLGKRTSGIKISNVRERRAVTGFSSLSDNPIKLYLANNRDGMHFSNTLIFPGYFNSRTDFLHFILFLASAKAFDNKHLVIHFSATQNKQSTLIEKFNELMLDTNLNFKARLIEAGIGDLDFIDVKCDDNNPVRHEHIQTIGRHVKIFYHCWLSDADYDALYHIAPMVGVSGDNTLERAISFRKLPYYAPTYVEDKSPSFEGLYSACKHMITDSALLADFRYYFLSQNFVQFKHGHCISNQIFNRCVRLDLESMCNVWSRVCNHLLLRRNAYRFIETWVDEALSTRAESCEDTPSSICLC